MRLQCSIGPATNTIHPAPDSVGTGPVTTAASGAYMVLTCVIATMVSNSMNRRTGG